MAEVNRLPMSFATPSPGRGPLGVRAALGFPSHGGCSLGEGAADGSSGPTLPRRLDPQSPSIDGPSPPG
jgi:hypothetical protein